MIRACLVVVHCTVFVFSLAKIFSSVYNLLNHFSNFLVVSKGIFSCRDKIIMRI